MTMASFSLVLSLVLVLGIVYDSGENDGVFENAVEVKQEQRKMRVRQTQREGYTYGGAALSNHFPKTSTFSPNVNNSTLEPYNTPVDGRKDSADQSCQDVNIWFVRYNGSK